MRGPASAEYESLSRNKGYKSTAINASTRLKCFGLQQENRVKGETYRRSIRSYGTQSTVTKRHDSWMVNRFNCFHQPSVEAA